MIIAALIAAAGSSTRMGAGVKKEYCLLPESSTVSGSAEVPETRTVLRAAVAAFAENPRINYVVVVHPFDGGNGEWPARQALGESWLSGSGHCPVRFVPGGTNRFSSVYRGLTLLAMYQPDMVLIHDGARPWVRQALINSVIDAALKEGAAIPVVPLTETPKQIEDGFVERHIPRSKLALAQTPQAFLFQKIFTAHKALVAGQDNAEQSNEWTDDAAIYGAAGGKIAVVAGDPDNRKITYAKDL